MEPTELGLRGSNGPFLEGKKRDVLLPKQGVPGRTKKTTPVKNRQWTGTKKTADGTKTRGEEK